MTHQYMPKIFHDPNKNGPPPSPTPHPTYLLYDPLLISSDFRVCWQIIKLGENLKTLKKSTKIRPEKENKL